MAFGVVFRRTSNQSARKPGSQWTIGDLVCIYEAAQCADDPSPNSPHGILVVSDGPSASEVRPLIGPQENAERTTLSRCRWYLNPASLPTPSAGLIASGRRAVVTYEQFQTAVFDKETGLDMKFIHGAGRG